MKQGRRILAAVIGGGILLGAAAGAFLASTPLSAEDSRVVRVLAPSSTASTPLFVLAKLFEPAGIEIDVEVFVNHPQALVGLVRGETDLLFTGTSVGWENRLNGGPVVMVNTGVWGVSHLVGREPAVSGFEQLRGMRLSLPFPGSPLDFQTRAILARHGIDPEDDLAVSYAPFTQTIPRLVRGQVDVAPLPEPLATHAVRQGLFRLVSYREAWAGATGGDGLSPQVSLFATAGYLRGREPVVDRIVERWRRAAEHTVAQPDDAARISASYLSFDIPLIREAIGNTDFLVPSFEENRRRVTAYYRAVREYLPGRRGELGRGFFYASGRGGDD